MARRTKEEAKETREKILKAALDLFSEKGYFNTTFVDIAERIDLTKGAVYWHFKTKPDLLTELINIMLVKEDKLTKKKVPQLETLDDLRNYFVRRAELVLEDEECNKFMFFLTLQMEWTVETLAFIRDKIKQFKHGPFKDIRRLLSKVQKEGKLRNDVDVENISEILIGMYKGLVEHHLSGFAETNLIECVDVGFRAVIDSIALPKSMTKEARNE